MHAAARSRERLEGVLEGGTVRGLLTGAGGWFPQAWGVIRAGLTCRGHPAPSAGAGPGWGDQHDSRRDWLLGEIPLC